MIRFRIASFLFSIQSELTQLVARYSLITLPISPPLVVHLLILITFTKLISLPSSMALTIGLKYSYLHTLLIELILANLRILIRDDLSRHHLHT
jgi:hypothetical protein